MYISIRYMVLLLLLPLLWSRYSRCNSYFNGTQEIHMKMIISKWVTVIFVHCFSFNPEMCLCMWNEVNSYRCVQGDLLPRQNPFSWRKNVREGSTQEIDFWPLSMSKWWNKNNNIRRCMFLCVVCLFLFVWLLLYGFVWLTDALQFINLVCDFISELPFWVHENSYFPFL